MLCRKFECIVILVFFFKQKTAYEMRISDWSSDVCSSDLLVAIDVDHLEGPDVEGAGTLFIPSSKTDQEGEGAYAYLSPETMAAIGRWREAARIESDPLFRRVETHFDGSIASVGRSALHPNSITLIYKRLIRASGKQKLLGAMGEAEVERWE